MDDCPLLPVGTARAEWFNFENSQVVYPKPEGLMDPFYLAHLFQTIERNIIRIALTRSQPGFKKTAGEAVTKLIVGNLQPNQWEQFKKLKLNVSGKIKPMEKKRKISKPGLRKRKLPEVIESLIWDTKKDQELPPLDYNDCWYLNKWLDGDSVWRSWISHLSIVWNSFYGIVYIVFGYVTQWYQPRLDQWIEN